MKSFVLRCTAVLFVAMTTAVLSAADVFFPKPISSELPIYPERARAAHVAGTVKLWFVLDRNGKVAKAEVISGNPMLRDAAASTVKSWRFRLEGIRENVRYETEFVYVLNTQSKEGEPKLTVSMTDLRRVEVVSEIYFGTIE